MAAVTICSDFGVHKGDICHYFHFLPLFLPWSNGARSHDLSFSYFLIFSFKLALSLFFFTLIKNPISFSSLSAITVALSTYLRLFMFLLSILIPAYNASNLAFLIMCSAYRLIKHSDSRQPCYTTFSILNQSVFPYRFVKDASWPTYRFLRRQAR